MIINIEYSNKSEPFEYGTKPEFIEDYPVHNFVNLYAVEWHFLESDERCFDPYHHFGGDIECLDKEPYDFVWGAICDSDAPRSWKQLETFKSLCEIVMWADNNLDYLPDVWISVTSEFREDLVIRFLSEEDITLFRIAYGHRILHDK